MASSDIEQENTQNQNQGDEHSDETRIMNNRFRTNHKEAKLFLEIVDKLTTTFEGMPTDDIITLFWGERRSVIWRNFPFPHNSNSYHCMRHFARKGN